MSSRVRYLFLDEAGNFDFSPSGTAFFILGSLFKERPFAAYRQLTELKYDLIEGGQDLEYFHASHDRQHIRNQVFSIIASRLEGCRIDASIVEKSQVQSAQRDDISFYCRVVTLHLCRVFESMDWTGVDELLVITDRVPVNSKRRAVEKAIKQTLAQVLGSGFRHRIMHHDSKSNPDLQIADYCTWAIQRKWMLHDERSHRIIAPAVGEERLLGPEYWAGPPSKSDHPSYPF